MNSLKTNLKFSFSFTHQLYMLSHEIKPQIIPFHTYEPIDGSCLFGNSKPLNIEIGTGNGDFILHSAINHSQENFLGFEIVKQLIIKTAKKIMDNNLKNIRLIHYDAVFFIKMFKNNSVKNIYINFPDPWPKRRHHKRRIIKVDFLELVYHKLEKNGLLYIVTDFEDYALSIINNILKTPFKSVYKSICLNHLDNYFETKYYRKFSKENKTFFFKLRKTG
jgi:tRNA (guanine-N7-)-methyltransferase